MSGHSKIIKFIYFFIVALLMVGSIVIWREIPVLQKWLISGDVVILSVSWLIYALFIGFNIFSLLVFSIFLLVLINTAEGEDLGGSILLGLVVVFVVFGSYFVTTFKYATYKGAYSRCLFGEKYIAWKQVKEINIDIYTRSKGGGSRLVYFLKSQTDEGIDINDTRLSGSLVILDQMLTKQNIKFNVDKLKNNSRLELLKSQDRIVAESHLRVK